MMAESIEIQRFDKCEKSKKKLDSTKEKWILTKMDTRECVDKSYARKVKYQAVFNKKKT